MIITKTEIKDVLKIETRIFGDNRGTNVIDIRTSMKSERFMVKDYWNFKNNIYMRKTAF